MCGISEANVIYDHVMFPSTCQINNGASFVKVDRIYNKRDNSPALLFQGVLSCPFYLVVC